MKFFIIFLFFAQVSVSAKLVKNDLRLMVPPVDKTLGDVTETRNILLLSIGNPDDNMGFPRPPVNPHQPGEKLSINWKPVWNGWIPPIPIPPDPKKLSVNGNGGLADPVQDELDSGRPTEKQLVVNLGAATVNWKPVDQQIKNTYPYVLAVKEKALRECVSQDLHYQEACLSDVADEVIAALIAKCENNEQVRCLSQYGFDELARVIVRVITKEIKLASCPAALFILYGRLGLVSLHNDLGGRGLAFKIQKIVDSRDIPPPWILEQVTECRDCNWGLPPNILFPDPKPPQRVVIIQGITDSDPSDPLNPIPPSDPHPWVIY